MRIAVYCSAREGLPQSYADDARAFGRWLGEKGHTLVYGGLARGLMATVATAAAEAGAKVVGIVPESRRQWVHPANTVSIGCCSLHERKEMMEQQADAFVALEGGVGTLDEAVSALASMIFNGEQKPLAMLSRGGLYAPLGELLRGFAASGLAGESLPGRVRLCASVGELESYLDQF